MLWSYILFNCYKYKVNKICFCEVKLGLNIIVLVVYVYIG